MENRFCKARYSFFSFKSIKDTFVYNSKHFDIIVVRWNGPSIFQEYDEQKKFWNIYIRFMPSFPDFDKLPNNYLDFDLISFGATYYREDGKSKIFGNDYISNRKVINCNTFDENNRCFVDAHKILEELEQICKGAENGR